jgi:hypothetical protein
LQEFSFTAGLRRLGAESCAHVEKIA